VSKFSSTPRPHRMYQQPWPTGDYSFFQIGWIVEDVLKIAQKWVDVYGVGPFHVMPRKEMTVLYRGEQTTWDFQTVVAQAGPVQIELIEQFCDRPSIYNEVFPRGQSGVHQICTVTRAYEDAISHYVDQGYDLAAEISTRGGRVGYVDTLEDFGIVTEVVEESPEFVSALAKISATCKDWDGSDPIRIMTRDGYRLPDAG
jgi:Glyoxalase/Bleomycin resistance protein/Dioxygenase superfamily